MDYYGIGVGVRPESDFFFFSPDEKTKDILYYLTQTGRLCCTKDYYIRRSSFPHLLLLSVTKGVFYLELGGQKYEAHPNQIVLLDCHQPHYYYAKDELEFLFMHFDGPQARVLCHYINELSGIVIDEPYNAEVIHLMGSMIQSFQTNSNKSIFEVSSMVYQILMKLDRPVTSARLRKNSDSINQTLNYIHTHLNEKLTLHELAEMAGLSDYYFSHLFKEMTGFAPRNYIVEARLDQVKKLLISTDLSIAQIARQLHYPNSSNLIVQFTNRTGCTPAAFRGRNLRR